MANQMIALQARAPQVDPLGGAIRSNAAMINMMQQQKAAERQTAVAQQQMELARSKEARDISAAEVDRAGKMIDYYTKRAGQTMTPEGYALLLQSMDKDAPEVAAAFRANLPPERFDRNDMLRMVGSISDNFKTTYGPLETEVVQADDGTFMVARTGGFEKPGVFEMEQFNLKPGGAAQAPAAPPVSAAPGVSARPTRGAATGPQDLLRQGIDPNSIPSGNPLSPIAYNPAQTGAPQTDLGAVVQNMMQTGVVSQSDFEAMRAAARGNDAQLADLLRSNNIRVMPDEAPAGGMRSAVYRPEEGAAAFQQAQSMGDYVGTGRAARGKSPMQSPLPGSAQVPLPRVRSEAGAGETGKGEASTDVELRKNLPKARGALDLAVKQLDRDLADVDYVLRTPEREMVVGNVEGRLPAIVNVFRKGGQSAQNVQSRLDKIGAKSVVTHLTQMREASPQGSSLFGQVTEYEDRLVKALAGLDQAQDEATFDRALQDYRGVIAEMRQNLPRVFNETYGRVGAKATATPTPKGGRAGPTVQDIEYLRRNIRNPGVADGFARHFGRDALNEAIGRR